jgi:hypothetical protein
MRTTLCIQASIRQPQPLDRTSMQQMFSHYLFDIFRRNSPIPNRIRIDHQNWPMLALVKTAKLIRPNLPLQPSFLHRILEGRFELPATFAAATGPRCALVPFIDADKNMVLELCQFTIPSTSRWPGTQHSLSRAMHRCF